MTQELTTIRLEDYRPPTYLVDALELHVDLDPTRTEVRARLQLQANPDSQDDPGELHLDGRLLQLLQVKLDGRELSASEYVVDTEGLTITGVPEKFVLETLVTVNPEGNTALEGLYRASGIYCTQCEPEGFRKITFYPDRPDVMARFTVTVVGALTDCPILLSNGNLIASGPLRDGRHFATFEDPFPKPSYLFALVAGKLTAIEDRFVTTS
jgi:aminopeptidase N